MPFLSPLQQFDTDIWCSLLPPPGASEMLAAERERASEKARKGARERDTESKRERERERKRETERVKKRDGGREMEKERFY